MINKNPRKSLACINGKEILILIWNNPHRRNWKWMKTRRTKCYDRKKNLYVSGDKKKCDDDSMKVYKDN